MTEDEALYELAREVGQTLSLQGRMLVLAESCTGGWVSHCITDVPGSSAWFDRGFVTYSNRSKCELLGVAAETLRVYGAVSGETVRAMAVGALSHSAANIAAAVSGIAGPTGGTPDKPVGTVWFAWQRDDGIFCVQSVRFGGDRRAVRRQAVRVALQGILDVCRD
ncbi:competence/damage inducible protein CinA [Methylocaldum marinum]|uniref:Competence/damage inducible protein CinA n=1 Tax=Methylocaldum marinum TaxID=1432792 RepID=A0A250KSQ7_9GAMM|nr:CinA family protein [Methylocaldum marinum]BBA34602.1 competence/damage inducible protein CinA [Methylocaldum marinum]